MSKQNEPDGDPDVDEVIKRITESPRPTREPSGDPDVRGGLTSLTGSGDQQDK
ncbi:hypothetical protein [Agromyces subbeticus]|uniref:hypothetical protein n=1 Tax=Agromyces subbeticus TaxID=293890 RepID=UPI0003B61AC8|nr:hypothetical protein [Agromyces subbeticus]